MAVDDAMQTAVRAAIARAAQATGVDFGFLKETARRESGLRADAKAATSSATGLFQFIEQTWLETLARHGAKHGRAAEAAAIDVSGGRARVSDPATRQSLLALRADPDLSARMAAELTRENAERLERGLGRAPEPGELYAAHVLGAGGALRLIAAARDGAPDASQLFPQAAAANRGLFYDRAGAPRSAAGLLERLNVDAKEAAPLVADARPRTEPGLSPDLVLALFGLGTQAAGGQAGADDTVAPEIALLRAHAYAALRGQR